MDWRDKLMDSWIDVCLRVSEKVCYFEEEMQLPRWTGEFV